MKIYVVCFRMILKFIVKGVHPKWLCWLRMDLAGQMNMGMGQLTMSFPGPIKQMLSG